MEEGAKQLNKEQQNLVVENHKLIYFYAHKMNLDLEEYYDLLAIGLCKAALTYEENKGKFSGYACACMQNELRIYWRNTYQLARCIPQELIRSLDTPFADNYKENNWNVDEALYGEYKIDISRAEVEEFIGSLQGVEKAVLIRTLQGYTQASIAEELKFSRSYINRIVGKLRRKWSNDNYRK